MCDCTRSSRFLEEVLRIDVDNNQFGQRERFAVLSENIVSHKIFATHQLALGMLPVEVASGHEGRDSEIHTSLWYCPEILSSSWLATHGRSVLRCTQVSVPDCVRELCDGCFAGCCELRRITFGPSSRLEILGQGCFDGTQLSELNIPDCVPERG